MERPTDMKYVEKGMQKVQPRLIEMQVDRLRRLTTLQSSLTFKKSTLEAALGMVVKKHKDWRFDAAKRSSFCSVVALRWMAMCRHVSQASLRKSPPMWYRRIFRDKAASRKRKGSEIFEEEEAEAEQDEEQEAQEDGEEEENDNQPEEEEEEENDNQHEEKHEEAEEDRKPQAKKTRTPTLGAYFYGYSQEMNAAWRCSPKAPLQREYTKVFDVDTDDELAAAVAVWPDGDKHEMPELKGISAEARSQDAPQVAARTKQKGRVFHRARMPDGSPLTVKDRSEGPLRPRICALFRGNKQICQATLHAPLSLDIAGEILTTIATELEAGTLSADKCYDRRDQIYKERGYPISKGNRAKPCEQATEPKSVPKAAKTTAVAETTAVADASSSAEESVPDVPPPPLSFFEMIVS